MTDKKLWIILGLFFAITIAASFGTSLTMNSAKYAQVSREIVESGDWINLTIAGEAYDQKPPLMFWAGAMMYRIFGVSDFSFKLAVLLLSLPGIIATYLLTKLLYNKKTAAYATVFWVLSLGYIYFHNDPHTDTALSSMVMLAIWLLVRYFEKGNFLYYIGGIISVGLAMLAKGPVGMVIPAMAIGAHLIGHRRWKDIFHWQWLVAVPLLLLAITPALIGLYNQFGMEGIKFYFWTNNVGRITGSYQGTNTDPVFYLHTALYVLAPVSVLAYFGFGQKIAAFISGIRNKVMDTELYTMGGILPYILVLSMAKMKNPHYMLAISPLMMILAANFLQRYLSEEVKPAIFKTIRTLHYIIGIAFWILIGLFVFWIYPEDKLIYWLLLGLFLTAVAWVAIRQTSFNKEFGILAFSFTAFLFSLFFSFYPHMKTYHAPYQAIEIINEETGNMGQIHLFLPEGKYWELFYYCKNVGTYYETVDEIDQLMSETGDWIFTGTKGLKLILDRKPDTRVIEFNHRQIAQQTPAFLNPKTRASKLSKLYLVKLPNEGNR